ncbi:MAG: hypothetical protein ABSG58_00625 [Acidimicrobiales bacterium]
MINPNFVFLAMALSVFGGYGYIRDTLKGETSPNRVTWSLWGIEGVLTFGVEVQQHVGLAAWMTLMLGLMPIAVVLASFHNSHAVWRIGLFDIICGSFSVAGLILWALVREPTVALVIFVCADQLAALPTIRKSWLVPSSETPRAFAMGCLNCAITVLTLKHWTTAGVLFPGCIVVTDFFLTVIIVARIGPRVRHELNAAA